MKKVEIGFISLDPKKIARCGSVCQEFGFSFGTWSDLESFMDEAPVCQLVVASAADPGCEQSPSEISQVVRQICKDAVVACVVPDSLSLDQAAEIKKFGTDWILLEEELFSSSKFEYLATQSLKATYFAIKTADLVPGAALEFDIYHLLPQRGKFLKFLFSEDVLSPEKFQKLSDLGEFYVHRSQLSGFDAYVRKHAERSETGLVKRCRSGFLALSASYTDLVLLLTDQSEHASFKKGQALLDQTRKLVEVLIETTGKLQNAWEVVNSSAIGEFGSVERTPAVAAYAAILGVDLGISGISEIMLAALLADIGLVLLPPKISRKIRLQELELLNPEDVATYRGYPNQSLRIALERKLPLAEKFRELMLATNERADGKGFPKGLPGRKISEGSQLIQFCKQFDTATVVRLGKSKPDRQTVLNKLIRDEVDCMTRYNPSFLEKLKHTLIKN